MILTISDITESQNPQIEKNNVHFFNLTIHIPLINVSIEIPNVIKTYKNIRIPTHAQKLNINPIHVSDTRKENIHIIHAMIDIHHIILKIIHKDGLIFEFMSFTIFDSRALFTNL